MDTVLGSPSMDHLQELEFSPRLLLPTLPSMSRFSATLRVATFRGCKIPYRTNQVCHFPKLKQLTLDYVLMAQCSLQSMINGCPALETLLIKSIDFRCLRINSPTLIGIGITARIYVSRTRELIVENAPCLQRLLHRNLTNRLLVTVISAPKLETLGRISDSDCAFNRIVFGDTVILRLQVESLTTVVHTIKILAVSMDTLSLDVVINLMRCFPSIEKLYIQASASKSKEKNLWRLKHRSLLKHLDIRLKTIVMECYHGSISQVNFVTFFLLNAKALELMRLRVKPEHYYDEFLAQQHDKLQLENMASRGAMLHFTNHQCIRHASDIDHVRDLSLRDPFHCSCCQ